MSENSAIQWTDHTFNPWIGCTKVSPGCANCYAETLDKIRFSKTLPGCTKDAPVSHWGKGAPRHRTSASNWKEPLKWNRKQDQITARFGSRTQDSRPRVFCASLADWLDEEVPIAWLADLLMLIRDTPNLDWLLLTKRPQNWRERMQAAKHEIQMQGDSAGGYYVQRWVYGDLPANVWIGTTVEDQKRANERIPQLLAIPAKVRFLSCEPLLEAVDIEGALSRGGLPNATADSQGIDWVITGGESGPGCRPADVEWFRSIKKQCAAAGVPFFMKQLGGVRDHRGNLEDFPEDLRVREFPTGKAVA